MNYICIFKTREIFQNKIIYLMKPVEKKPKKKKSQFWNEDEEYSQVTNVLHVLISASSYTMQT